MPCTGITRCYKKYRAVSIMHDVQRTACCNTVSANDHRPLQASVQGSAGVLTPDLPPPNDNALEEVTTPLEERVRPTPG